jgi:hypothetical protein
MESLQVWAEAAADGISDPGWHIHITDTDGNELTITIGSEAGRRRPLLIDQTENRG